MTAFSGASKSGVAWITGAGGLVGHQMMLQSLSCASRFAARSLSRSDVDLRDSEAVRSLFERERPAIIVHCAALSKNPACTADPRLAYDVNVETTRRLSELIVDGIFVFISTDLVFDGVVGNYLEESIVNPLSVYAETKVQAEAFVRQHPRHLIVRLSLNAGISPTGDRGFNEEMRLAWQQGRALDLFEDEFRNPISVTQTARALWQLIDQEASGTFHLAGSERLSRYEIGRLVAARYSQLSPKINPSSLKDYRGAPRSPDTSLNCAKLQKHLNFALPKFSEWIASCSNVEI
ncbi:MAG: SDR family oxidoreductase [Pedosphaera sp.]|nr:SDR family oxidoreductase [Pedosphaera sp.]